MEVAPLHPEDTAAIDEVWSMWIAAHKHDSPDHQRALSKSVFIADLNNTKADERHEFRLARIDGRLVGHVRNIFTVHENRHLGFADVWVDPRFRRQGIGTALLDTATRICRDNGSTVQTANATESVPGGPKRSEAGRDFLLHHGFSLTMAMRMRRLDLQAIDGEVEQDLLDDAWRHASGYELVQWTGATPKEHAAGAAALFSRLVSDVPHGDIDVDDVTLDVDRLVDRETSEMERGHDFACAYIRHIDSGDLVAHSVIAVNRESPQYGGQWITLVHPDHRGHRLGMIVKIENHRQLRRTHPDVRWIDSSNAEVNSHMVAINEKLGFTEVGRHLTYKRDI